MTRVSQFFYVRVSICGHSLFTVTVHCHCHCRLPSAQLARIVPCSHVSRQMLSCMNYNHVVFLVTKMHCNAMLLLRFDSNR